jgi:NAD(P)-dependent dehydrogenase (short-subunit alcohol dehydrogenase family)
MERPMTTSGREVLEGATGAAGMVLAFFTPFLRAWRDHWGLSPELAERPLAGDAVAGPGAYQWTHGLEIDAPASLVWPWVAQVGQARGGFYSYEFLENLVGCAIDNADRLHPEWQDVALGAALRLHPEMPPLPVMEVAPGRHFVVGASINPTTGAQDDGPGALRVSWLFLVEPVDALRCRFISRFRIHVPDGVAGYSIGLLEPAGFVMDRRMLLGVRERVPSLAPSLAQVGPLALEGKVCLVTGATRGIGRATADWLARAGATVGLLCRDVDRAEEVRAALVNRTGRDDAAVVVELDLASMASVRRAAAAVLARFPRIDVLVHNAGHFDFERRLTDQGFEQMLAVGYLGPWLLTRLLEERLVASAPSRVVVTAGIYHRKAQLDLDDMHFETRSWDAMAANNQMQLARASFALELARRLDGRGVTVNAVHPGAVRTHTQDLLTGWQRLLVDTLGRFIFVDPERGAMPNLRLAGEVALEGVTGRFFDGLREAAPSEDARDPQLAARLWRWTEATVG